MPQLEGCRCTVTGGRITPVQSHEPRALTEKWTVGRFCWDFVIGL